jgi:hypothetical protein
MLLMISIFNGTAYVSVYLYPKYKITLRLMNMQNRKHYVSKYAISTHLYYTCTFSLLEI